MSTDARSLNRLTVRAQLPVCLAITLLWLIPMVFVLLIAMQGRETVVVRAWSRYWYLLYVLSLSTWWWLPNKWFKPAAWEPALYRALGVRKFKVLMVGGDWHNARIRKHVSGYRIFATEATRPALLAETVAAEKTHTVMLLFALWPTLLGAALGWWTYVAIISAGNIIVNVYPIMLQRQTRARITDIDHRRQR